VLLGVTALGIYDVRNTPFSTTSTYPGLEGHATVVHNLLTKSFLDKPKWAVIYDLFTLIFLSVLTGVILPRLNAVYGILFAAGLFTFHLFASEWLFVSYGIWINIVYPLLALILTYTSLTVYRYFTEERRRKQIKGAFSHYVSSSVVNEMLRHPERLKLGGDKKDLTVLFSDIRGFTTISERMTPEDLVHLLNEYLTIMTNVVFKYDGTLDKYMGDAIMAIYGAPLERQNHPSNACHAALEMMEALKNLNEKWIKEGKEPLDIGIGISTGMMMVGNMGSEQRFDYTVMGDAVNLGSRLEGANKNYKSHIIISESTHGRIEDEFFCMELDSVRVKGKTKPVKIYQLLAYRKIAEERQRAGALFHRGLQLYRARKWDEAIKTFSHVSDMDPELHAADLYIKRCKNLKTSPPPPNWDGVFKMTTK
jgi:adenylate cyclase